MVGGRPNVTGIIFRQDEVQYRTLLGWVSNDKIQDTLSHDRQLILDIRIAILIKVIWLAN